MRVRDLRLCGGKRIRVARRVVHSHHIQIDWRQVCKCQAACERGGALGGIIAIPHPAWDSERAVALGESKATNGLTSNVAPL